MQMDAESASAVATRLRRARGQLDGVLAMIPVARVGFLGMYRDEDTLQPVSYYEKLPKDLGDRLMLIIDPMLATGGSASYAAQVCKDRGAHTGCSQIDSGGMVLHLVVATEPDAALAQLGV